MPRLAIRTGNDCSNLLGAFRVRIDGNMPPLHRFASIGFLVNPHQPLLPIQPGIHSILAACDQNRVEAQLPGPIGILRGKLYHRIPPQGQISGNGIAIFICGVISNGFPVGISDSESPAAQVIAGVGGCGHSGCW